MRVHSKATPPGPPPRRKEALETQERLPSEGPARVVILEGGPVGQRFDLAGTVIIGRSKDATISLVDGGISREHARIVCDGSYRIEDLGSRNGTFVNGTQVQGSAPLRFGDRIRVGHKAALLFTHFDAVEEQMLQRQRLETLGRMAAGLAHDFNNMLAAIVATQDYLLSAPTTATLADEDVRDCLIEARAAAGRAAELTPRLLGAVRGNNGSHGPFDVAEICREIARLAERTFDRRIRIDESVSERLPVQGDQAEIHQVVMNLFLNARDAMKAGGRLGVTARRATPDELARDGITTGAPHAMVIVEDSGEGMDEATRVRIFEPFFSTKEGAGFGLGLASARQMVVIHGGHIDVDSAPGAGARFRILLPLSAARELCSARETVAQEASPRPVTPQRLMIVDDDALVRKAYARSLRRAGYDVLEAPDGHEALKLFRTASPPPALVLLDLDMPHLSGEETFRMLRYLEPDLPVVIQTGHRADSSRLDGLMASGAVGFMLKPCPVSELLAEVDAALALSAQMEDSSNVTDVHSAARLLRQP
jgi:signal transduction histidine kinase/CheY-like chemotaxis protein